MTDIYTDGETPVLDYAEAARTLANVRHLGSDKLKAEAVARVQAASLLDIAVTLNALAHGIPLAEVREVGPDGEPMGDEEREGDGPDEQVDDSPLEVGDWVRPHPVDYDDATQLDPPSKVLAVGVSEGAAWVDLEHYDDDGSVLSSGVRAWAENYRRAVVPEPAEVETTADDNFGDIDPRDLVDDIDSDFDVPAIDEPVKPAKVKSSKGKSKSKGGE